MASTDSSHDHDSLAGGECREARAATEAGQDRAEIGPHHAEFLIEITATFILCPEATQEPATVDSSVSKSTELSLFLTDEDEDEALSGAGARSTVACALVRVHMQPHHAAEAIDQILEYCRGMAAEAPQRGGVQRLDVEIEVPVDELPDFGDSDGVGEDALLRFVAASEEVIEGLEKMRISDEVSEKECCVVCLEDMSAGSEATRLPCSHHFHGDCIVKWLSTSKFCPLCRFELPS